MCEELTSKLTEPATLQGESSSNRVEKHNRWQNKISLARLYYGQCVFTKDKQSIGFLFQLIEINESKSLVEKASRPIACSLPGY